jgi:hypothetical protein
VQNSVPRSTEAVGAGKGSSEVGKGSSEVGKTESNMQNKSKLGELEAPIAGANTEWSQRYARSNKIGVMRKMLMRMCLMVECIVDH